MDSRLFAWSCWTAGAVLFPLGGFLARAPSGPTVQVLLFSGRAGSVAWCVWALAFALMTYAALRLGDAPRRAVVAAQLLGGLVMTLTPIFPSNDPLAYLLYGEVTTHAESAWHPKSIDPGRDAVAAAGTAAWHNPPTACVYGPVLVAVETAVVRVFSADNLPLLLLVQRGISLAAAVAVTLLLKRPSAGFWGLHPLVLFESAVAAHNDVLMLFLLAAAWRVRSRAHPRAAAIASAALVVAAASVKIVAVGVAAFRPKRLGWVLAIFLLVAATAHDTLGLAQLRAHQTAYPVNSPMLLLTSVIERVTHAAHAQRPAKAAIDAAALLALAGLAYRAYRLRRMPRDYPTLATLVFIASISIVYPWYFTWTILAATTASRRMRTTVAIAATLCFVFEYRALTTWNAATGLAGTAMVWGGVALLVARAMNSRPAAA